MALRKGLDYLLKSVLENIISADMKLRRVAGDASCRRVGSFLLRILRKSLLPEIQISFL